MASEAMETDGVLEPCMRHGRHVRLKTNGLAKGNILIFACVGHGRQTKWLKATHPSLALTSARGWWTTISGGRQCGTVRGGTKGVTTSSFARWIITDDLEVPRDNRIGQLLSAK